MATAPTRRARGGAVPSTSGMRMLLILLTGSTLFIVGGLVGWWFSSLRHGADSALASAHDDSAWTSLTSSKFKPRTPGLRTTSRGVQPGGAPAASSAPVPAAATPPATEPAAEQVVGDPKPPSVWGDFDGRTSVVLDAALDDVQISGGAWIYLDSSHSAATVKTVMSNRRSGCAADDDHRGFSLFVNTWPTNDRALILEWSDMSVGGAGGCHTIASDAGTIPQDKWVHVAFALRSTTNGRGGTTAAGTPQHGAMLFLNGQLLRAVDTGRTAADVQDGVRTSMKMHIGSGPGGDNTFVGRIAHVFLMPSIITPLQLRSAITLDTPASLLQLAEAGRDRLSLLLLLAPSASLTDLLALLSQEAVLVHPTPGMLATDLSGKHKPRGSPARPPAPGTNTGSASLRERPSPASQGDAGVRKVPAAIRRERIPGTAPADWPVSYAEGGNQWLQRMIRLPASMASGSTTDKAALADGTFSDEVSVEQLVASDKLGRERAAAVKAAMQHAWRGYKERAWGADELRPVSGTPNQAWGNVGMTLVDSLDTLYLMGMEEEFKEARDWVASQLSFDRHHSISVFEVTIRELGGLLSAYDLSGDDVFLTKARDLADRLLPAFNTPSGVPVSQVNLATGAASGGWAGSNAVLSEVGTLQVEFRYLSKATGDDTYARKAEKIIEKLSTVNPANGLFPIYVSTANGLPSSTQVTFGALGDSFYEYLVKVWLQGGRREGMYRTMYDAAMNGMTSNLLQRSTPSSLMYVADLNGQSLNHKMDHLVCFVPGMLALGAFTAAGTAGEANAARDLRNAKAIMYTCWQMYERMATGISAEYVIFSSGNDLSPGPTAPFYILRPEAAESLFIMHQLTGNPIYREWGWKMFQAIEKYCRTQFGYGSLPNVNDRGSRPEDRMESFFLAETLKYLYLLQSPDHPISLERYVFNTEAHPMRIFPEL